jgi:hypothetical protein
MTRVVPIRLGSPPVGPGHSSFQRAPCHLRPARSPVIDPCGQSRCTIDELILQQLTTTANIRRLTATGDPTVRLTTGQSSFNTTCTLEWIQSLLRRLSYLMASYLAS